MWLLCQPGGCLRYVGDIAGFSANMGTTISGMAVQYWKSVGVGSGGRAERFRRQLYLMLCQPWVMTQFSGRRIPRILILGSVCCRSFCKDLDDWSWDYLLDISEWINVASSTVRIPPVARPSVKGFKHASKVTSGMIIALLTVIEDDKKLLSLG